MLKTNCALSPAGGMRTYVELWDVEKKRSRAKVLCFLHERMFAYEKFCREPFGLICQKLSVIGNAFMDRAVRKADKQPMVYCCVFVVNKCLITIRFQSSANCLKTRT